MALIFQKMLRALALSAVVLLLVQVTSSAAAEWQWMRADRVANLLKEGSGLWLVDVRNESAFNEGHIEGAMLIPTQALASKRLPKGKVIVLVDDSLGGRAARGAAETLVQNGQDKVYVLEGGLPAWQGEGYPVAGKQQGRNYRRVMPDELAWAQENGIPLAVFDLRERGEKENGPVPQAQAVEGKTLTERLEKVKQQAAAKGKGLKAQLEKPATLVLVLPIGSDAKPLRERFRQVPGDVRYLEGAYAAWALRSKQNPVNTQGVCPTCPGGVRGGKL